MNILKQDSDCSDNLAAPVTEIKMKQEEIILIGNATAKASSETASTVLGSQGHNVESNPILSLEPSDFRNVKDERNNGESSSLKRGLPVESTKKTQSSLSATSTSGITPSSSTPAPTHSQHHPHPSYPQYYPPYSHGHTPYYYPPGPYYPPPPAHGGHQAYAPHSHYYAHYPPPPGYYPPPYPYHYPQPPTTTTTTPTTTTKSSRGGKSSPACVSTNSSKPKPKKTSPTSTISSTVSKPYSAFSATTPKPLPPKTLIVNSQPKLNSKPPVVTDNKKRKAVPETNAIFRANAKRTKQLAAESKAIAAAIAAKRAQSKEKARKELSQTVLDRRARKNAQSRLRASKLKDRIARIQAKAPENRNPEEKRSLEVFEERRQRKNGRSRERATERKKEYDRIMAVPETQWGSQEKGFVQETVVAKFKKNEGDRMRRKKLKDEFGSSAGGSSISSDFDTTSYSISERGSISNASRHVSHDKGIPDYVDSTNNEEDEHLTTLEGFVQSLSSSKDAPLTPVTQKEAYSLLDSTPTTFLNKNGNCFSPNFIFPSPSKNCRDFSANMDSIDFDSLELPTVGASILDQSMAIDDEVIYSPHFQPPCLNENERPQPSDKHNLPSLTPNIRLSPVNLPRRHNDYSPFPEIPNNGDNMKICDGENSNAIAVSFSVDTA